MSGLDPAMDNDDDDEYYRVEYHSTPADDDRDEDGDDTPPPPRFISVYEFVDDHLSDIYRRDVTGSQAGWCPQWWKHGEAVSRLEALWRAFEHLRIEGATGLATWWKDFADPTMTALFDPTGTFAGCSVARGHAPRLPPLPCEPMPIAELKWAMSDNLMRDTRRPTSTTEGTPS